MSIKRGHSEAVRAKLLAVVSGSYFLYLLPSLVQAVTSLLLIPITTHYLEPVDFGVFAIIVALVTPVKAFAASGARWVIGGNYHDAAEAERRAMLFTVLAFEFLLRCLLILLIFVASEPLLRSVVTNYRSDYVHFLHIALAGALAGSFWPAVSFLITVQGQPRSYALFSVVQIGLNALTTIFCLTVLGLGVESLFLAMLAASAASLVLELLYVRRFVTVSVKRRWLQEILSTGLRATPGSIAEMASNMTDKVFVQRWAGLGTLGLYSHSQQYQAVFKMLTAALSNTLTADGLKIFSAGLDPAPLKRALSLWYGIVAVLGVAVALFTDDVVELLTHGKFTDAAPLVLIWYLTVFSGSHAIPYASFLMARKHNRVLMHTQTVPTLCGIALVAVGAYHYGVFGAAWAWMATNVAIQGLRRWAAQRLGYRGMAESRFAQALVVYTALWVLDRVLSWSLTTELMICVLLIPTLVLYFRLVPDLLDALIRRQDGSATG